MPTCIAATAAGDDDAFHAALDWPSKRKKIIAWKFDAGIVHAIGAGAFPHFSAPRVWGREGGGSDRGEKEREKAVRDRGSIRCGQAA